MQDYCYDGTAHSMFVPPWESVSYDVRISNVIFMRVDICEAIEIRNLYIGYIISENRAYKLCWCVVVLSNGIIFGQVW